MPHYFVRGEAEFAYHGDCPDCETVSFTALVQGDSPEEAAEAALQAQGLAGDGHCHKAKWVRPPEVTVLQRPRHGAGAGDGRLPNVAGVMLEKLVSAIAKYLTSGTPEQRVEALIGLSEMYKKAQAYCDMRRAAAGLRGSVGHDRTD
jgi:hypothetical protein